MKILISLFISFMMLHGAVDVHLIAKKIDDLKRDNILSSEVDYKVYDPFRRAKPLLAKKKKVHVVRKPKPIVVETILNNRAWVDGRWVQKGSKINGAKVKAVKKNAIIVSYDNKDVIIPVKRGKSFLKLKEK